MWTRTLVATLAACTFMVSHGSAQLATIPGLIERARPEVPTWPCRQRELLPVPFEELVRGADVIVEARLRTRGTYLSADQTELFTEYDIAPSSTIAARPVLCPLVTQRK
jgi:hypothetical protein